ncbi:NADP-dependent oxidoreductase [Curtobacterium sp. MCPF17_046]|uniref:NADP-dependent oxidoreductase n=1 Tax=Curtobacterium sp. MCPF17_046 TaxID=2175663 RepID=UPI000D9A64D9|nr:NADP-dependent oxidoreductase [Curtobacterium sp. MCPF17_046]PYY39718.1 NADP-dependent oxidoreductase [Curtobacterium sp. MCPF17_046]
MVYTEYGSPEVLFSADVEEPHAGPGQVRVQVRAAGVNPVDWKAVAGSMSGGIPLNGTAIPGFDVAGVIDEVGDGVEDVIVGDAVFGQSVGGSVAEYALLEEWAAKPADLAWEVAGALNVVAETAVRVIDLLPLKPGNALLVDGAAGGVGLMVTQIAVTRGVTVLGTAAPRNHDLLRAIGAVPLTYGEGIAERARELSPGGVQFAVDTAGKGSLPELMALTGDPTRVVTIADRSATSRGAHDTVSPANRARSLRYVADLIVEGKLKLPIAATYAMDEIVDAYKRSQAGHVAGKIVLVP